MTLREWIHGTDSDTISIHPPSLPPSQQILLSMCHALDPEVQETLEARTMPLSCLSERFTSTVLGTEQLGSSLVEGREPTHE